MRVRNILLLFLIGGLVALVSCNDDDAKVEEVKDEDDQEINDDGEEAQEKEDLPDTITIVS